MPEKIDPQSAATVKLPRRQSLDLESADLSALVNAAHHLLRELDYYLELPGPLNWHPVVLTALALEREMMKLTPDLAQPEHADAWMPLYGPCSRKKAVPFRELWVLLRVARPNPTGCGERSGGVWVQGPSNEKNARAIAKRLRPIVKRFSAPAPRSITPKYIHSARTLQILDILNGKGKKLVQLAEILKMSPQQLSAKELKELKKAGLINWHRRVGYFRPDAPPPEVVP